MIHVAVLVTNGNTDILNTDLI